MNIHWSHGWALAGQSIVAAVLAAVVVGLYLWCAVLLGRYLHRCDVERQFRATLETERKAQVERIRLSLVRADAEVERRRLASDSVTAISDDKWREQARRAEALEWQDTDGAA